MVKAKSRCTRLKNKSPGWWWLELSGTFGIWQVQIMNNDVIDDELKEIFPLLTDLYSSRSSVISVSLEITSKSKKM